MLTKKCAIERFKNPLLNKNLVQIQVVNVLRFRHDFQDLQNAFAPFLTFFVSFSF